MSGSKKYTRSGKKGGGDDNAGNFVFSFPGSNPPSPSLNFGGSAPSSPLGSPTAAFGTINSASPTFPTFGAAPSSPSASNVFVFGGGTSSTPASPGQGMRRTATELAPNSPTVEVSDFRRANSDIGNPSSTFSFGSTNTTTTPGNTTGTGSSVFTFGAKTQPFTSTPTSTNTAPAPSSPVVPSTGFSFGSSTNTTPAKPASTSFSFGTTPTSGATATPSSTGFSFNPPAQNTSSTTPSGTASTLSFGSPAASTTTPSTTSPFSFGGSSVSSFDSPSTQKADTTTTSNTTGTASPFSFKAPTSSSTTTPAISSGSSLSSTPTSTATPTLSFGASTSATTNTPLKPTATTEKKDDATKKADAPATSAPSIFSFGSTTPSSTATTTTTSSSFSTKPAASTTTIPSIATPAPAAPSGPNLFSFSTILENLEKTATQPPNQIGAALVTPSLNALRQNQVVTHTNFRIDNILPSTRYTELPEQARKELDELDRYIHGESQRCDYIVKHAAPKRQEAMKDAKHDQEILASKLNSISSSLQIQVNATEELFDSLKEQIRHFSDGQSVIESCKNPSDRSARWLFGYGVDDDYFVNLSGRLATRLEEYKKCIREIEFTTDSWTKNRAQSPQDIARIMESQNQTFLAMTNKVAALHEKLNMEQDLYTQYRLQAITL